MNPLVIAQALKGGRLFFLNRKAQIAILLIILYFIFKKKLNNSFAIINNESSIRMKPKTLTN